MKIAIIKYNAGNVQSVLYALQRLGIQAEVTADQNEILGADKVIFPGVGHAQSAMEYLRNHGLDQVIVRLRQPVLGICLGLQLLCTHSEEGDTSCLGIFNTKVKKFDNSQLSDRESYKIPQMGWNTLYDLKSPLFQGVEENSYVYFVHSFYAELSDQTIATTDYTVPYSSALHKNNFYGVQFHPEKSAACGAKIIENFINLP
jgi:glutamine amidotransferase